MTPTVDVLGFALGAALVVAAFIFGLGRRLGRKEGVKEGLAGAPLEMRRAALQQGKCVLCGEGPGLSSEEADGDG